MSHALLQVIWFALWGLLWAIYFGLDGFDLGSGMLAAVYRKERERHLLIGSLAPIWDGSEVWVITAGGVTFAAFPKVYATLFSSLYLPFFLILLGLILRAVSIEFYHQMDYAPRWQRFWGDTLAVGSLVVALLFGVAFGNLFQGMLLDGQGYHGTLVSLLNPYGLLTGLLFVVAFLLNGANWMAHKSDHAEMRESALTFARRTWWILAVIAVAWLLYTPFATPLLVNFLTLPLLFLVPLGAVALLIATWVYGRRGAPALALLSGSLTVALLVITGVIGLFPNMFPSRLEAAASLTAYNASSSPYTLRLMLIVTLIFLPCVLLYQTWAYRLFGKGRTGSEVGHH